MNDRAKPPGRTRLGWLVEAILPTILMWSAIMLIDAGWRKPHVAQGAVDLVCGSVSIYVAILWTIARPLKRYFAPCDEALKQ